MVHNGVEYGLMQAYAEGFDLFDKCEYELDNAKIAHLWGQGSVVRSWLCELAARAFEAGRQRARELEGYTEDSGEGRWTIEDATDHDVPTPVITASLYARFYSRGNGDFTHRVLAALRNQFGGHAVKSADAKAPQGQPGGKREPMAVDQSPRTRSPTGLERLPVHPTTLVIFGATGDLAKRKLLPAIYNLAHEGALPERFNLVGVSRGDMPHGDFREMAIEAIARFSRRTPDKDVLEHLLEDVRYVPGLLRRPERLLDARQTLDEFDEKVGQPLNRAFYLSTAPMFFPVIVGALGARSCSATRRPRCA